ncbi:hypothetical protein HY498_05160 [Candidatus Woesearchaeota archaeon]|nr:hypothetical protein [Candidatus Woesearchaeota archaeon]
MSLVDLIKKSKEDQRVIIEGGFQDDWNVHHFDSEVIAVPYNITTIYTGLYNLDRVELKKDVWVPIGGSLDTVEKLDFNYIWGIVQRPCTILIEDGRIFHDLDILDGSSHFRLTSTLNALKKEYGKNYFEEAYRVIKSKKEKRGFSRLILSCSLD